MAKIDRRNRATAVGRAMALLLGGVLAKSALTHIGDRYSFLDAVLGYDLIGGNTALAAASLIPPFQLSLAVVLVLGWSPRKTLLMAAVLFAGFSAIQVSALVRGLDVSCGCFGTAAAVKVGPFTVGFAAMCAALAALGWGLTPRRET